jgi:hypothetical protein
MSTKTFLVVNWSFQSGFESPLAGMMDALKNIQSKGDLMMETIMNQKEVLINLRSEVDLAEMRLNIIQ